METDNKLGTTDIDSKLMRKKDGTPDFEKEKRAIKRELKRLGLKNANTKAAKE